MSEVQNQKSHLREFGGGEGMSVWATLKLKEIPASANTGVALSGS